MNTSENVCPVCKTNNELGVVVCAKCGAALDDPFKDLGHRTKTTDMEAPTPEMIREWSLQAPEAAVIPENGIAIYVEGRSRPVSIDDKNEVIIGRKSASTSEMLLDFAPFGGYSLGLSRRHVIIRRTGDSYQVMDLGSVNGTFLNEQRLVPHVSYALPSGSHLRLGRMRLVVFYRRLGKAG